MARNEPVNITRQRSSSASIPSSVTTPNVAKIEKISTLDQVSGGEEVEKVLVINPR